MSCLQEGEFGFGGQVGFGRFCAVAGFLGEVRLPQVARNGIKRAVSVGEEEIRIALREAIKTLEPRTMEKDNGMREISQLQSASRA